MPLKQSIQRFLLPAMMASAIGLASAPGLAVEVKNFEVGGAIGFIDPAGKRNIDSDPAALLTFGARLDGPWGAEIAAMFGNDISLLGLRGLYHFNELPGAWTPYVSAGLGITDPKPGDHDTTGLVGVGVKHPLNENLGLRAEFNLHQGFDSGALDKSIFVGLTWTWGNVAATRTAAATTAATAAPVAAADGDADRDGVIDSRDRCPNTPAGTKVNSEGCTIDTDGDGVNDLTDNCPGTPAGTTVNMQGCVPDGDADKDGILDSADRCPGTPAGAKVNNDGCEPVTTAIQDTDGDGVADDKDKCSNTPSGAKVDADGCTQKLSQKVSITLMLNFDTDKADIKPAFSDDISKVAKFMREYPGTSVVIEGHTDNTGNSDYNQKLSQRRAEAVADSLVRDHGIPGNRVKAVGYGDSRPVADNNTSAGRAQNRRVEAAIEENVSR